MRRLAFLLLIAAVAIAAAVLSGCTRAREVLVERPAPPPTVEARTDTLVLASPPDTLFVPREVLVASPPRVVRDSVYLTVPVEVVRYLDPRPMPERAFRLFGLEADSSRLTLFGTGADLRYRLPRPGERLTLQARSTDSLVAVVTGRPVRPPPHVVEAPACPECTVGPGLPARLRLYGLFLAVGVLGAVVGFIAGSVLRAGR